MGTQAFLGWHRSLQAFHLELPIENAPSSKEEKIALKCACYDVNAQEANSVAVENQTRGQVCVSRSPSLTTLLKLLP